MRSCTASRPRIAATSHSRAVERRGEVVAAGPDLRDRVGEHVLDQPAARPVDEGQPEPERPAEPGQIGLVGEDRVREHRHAVVDRLVRRVQPVVSEEGVGLPEHAPLVDVTVDRHVRPRQPLGRVLGRRATEADDGAEVVAGGDEGGDPLQRLEDVFRPPPPAHRPQRDVELQPVAAAREALPGGVRERRRVDVGERAVEGDGLEGLAALLGQPLGRLAVDVEMRAQAPQVRERPGVGEAEAVPQDLDRLLAPLGDDDREGGAHVRLVDVGIEVVAVLRVHERDVELRGDGPGDDREGVAEDQPGPERLDVCDDLVGEVAGPADLLAAHQRRLGVGVLERVTGEEVDEGPAGPLDEVAEGARAEDVDGQPAAGESRDQREHPAQVALGLGRREDDHGSAAR
jgi:hypothetical protein